MKKYKRVIDISHLPPRGESWFNVSVIPAEAEFIGNYRDGMFERSES